MTKRVCVVGAGVTGITCADRLATQGVEVVIYEKSRGIGGRLATRRTDGPTFDHGAQYVSAKGEAFARHLLRCVEQGRAAVWSFSECGAVNGNGEASTERYVGVPGMPDLFRGVAEALDIRFGIEIGAIGRDGRGWRVAGEFFDAVVCTAPAPQTVDLLNEHSDIAVRAAQAYYAPTMAAMVGVAEPTGLAFDTARDVDETIGWVARNSSKPGRADGGEQWVIQATAKWSARHLDTDKAEIADLLLSAFKAVFPDAQLQKPFTYFAGHRWRYAQVLQALGEPCLFDEDAMLGAAGDWCLGNRVEDAFNSGLAVADAVGSVLAVKASG